MAIQMALVGEAHRACHLGHTVLAALVQLGGALYPPRARGGDEREDARRRTRGREEPNARTRGAGRGGGAGLRETLLLVDDPEAFELAMQITADPALLRQVRFVLTTLDERD